MIRRRRREWREQIFFCDRLSQFHQHFTCSFYAGRSQKRQEDSQLKQLFALSGSVSVKAAHKHIDEIDPCFFSLSLTHKWENSNLAKWCWIVMGPVSFLGLSFLYEGHCYVLFFFFWILQFANFGQIRQCSRDFLEFALRLHCFITSFWELAS